MHTEPHVRSTQFASSTYTNTLESTSILLLFIIIMEWVQKAMHCAICAVLRAR